MRLMTVALLLMPLNACIYYDNQGDCEGCGWDWQDDTGYWGDTDVVDDTASDDTAVDDTASDTSDPDPVRMVMSLTPNEAELGATIIASLTEESGADLSTVESVRFFGAVTVDALEARPSEVLMSLKIGGDGEIGPVDLLAEFDDGTAVFLEGALNLVAPAEPPPPDDECPCECP